MPTTNEDEQLDKMMLDQQMALRRDKRLIEFMRIVCHNEAHFLRDPGVQGGNNARLSVQNEDAHSCH